MGEKVLVPEPSPAQGHRGGRLDQLPSWPALMDTEMAASYVGLCPATFQLVASRYSVAAVDLGVRATRWRKADLDRLVDRLPARGDPKDTAPVDLAQAALERARRRAK